MPILFCRLWRKGKCYFFGRVLLTQAVGDPRPSSSHSPNSTIFDAETSSGSNETSIDGAVVSKEAVIIDPYHFFYQDVAQMK